MIRLYSAISMLVLALLGALMTPAARASEWNEETIETFNEPVEIPGRVLPAGTYVFKLLDSDDPNIVQITNKDQTHVYATLLAIADQRMTPADHPVLRFEERKHDSPEAIKEWFYPGLLEGEEFVYPKG